MSDRFREWISVALTGVTGEAGVAAAVFFRDELPLSRSVARILGFCILYGGMALFLWAALHLKGAISGGMSPRLNRLVVGGPFRVVRHPVYVAMAIALIGASIVTRSAFGLLAVALLFLPAEIHRAKREKRALEEKFGNSWKEYAVRTGFFFPRFGRGHPA